MAVLAIGRDHVVFVVERIDSADRDRFLARIQMAETGDLPTRVHLGDFVFKAPDQAHPAVEFEQLAVAQGEKAALRSMFVPFERHCSTLTSVLSGCMILDRVPIVSKTALINIYAVVFFF